MMKYFIPNKLIFLEENERNKFHRYSQYSRRLQNITQMLIIQQRTRFNMVRKIRERGSEGKTRATWNYRI